MAPTRSPYVYTETLVIQAEETLFSVPKHILALPGTSFESTLLLPTSNQDLPSVPTTDQPNAEGRSDDNPIRLPESIMALHFTHFLSFIYPNSGHFIPEPSSLDDWMGVYNLAAMWGFDTVQEEASTALRNRISAKEGLKCIVLGLKYDVGPWIKRGIDLLVRQHAALDLQKMKDAGLSLGTICSIYSCRDKAIIDNAAGLFDSDIDRDESVIKQGSETIFASEFSAYVGLGKDSLDVVSASETKVTLVVGSIGKKKKKKTSMAASIWD